MKESEAELFHPLKKYLEQKGYTVYAEVKNCDIAAVKDNDLVLIELKNSLSLKLVLQGVERQELGNSVYIAAAVRGSKGIRQKKRIVKLLKRLGLGFILIRLLPEKEEVDILLNPGRSDALPAINTKKRKALLKEMGGRYRDFNTGGSVSSIETITAYRLKAIQAAVILEKNGTSSPSHLKEQGASFDVQSILYNNYYGWFERTGRGHYTLSEKGREILKQYPEQTEHFRNNLKTHEHC